MDAHHHHHIDDDVNMLHVEERQMQDLPQHEEQPQQQQDENDDDDEADQDDDVANDDNENFAEAQRHFELTCGQIEQNDADVRKFDCTRIGLNDARAVLLGRALLGNTQLTKLTVRLRDETEFTSHGARAFIGGYLGSQVKSLTLRGLVELPLEMSQLSARSIERLALRFPIGNEFAMKLCESLTANKSLTHLSLISNQMNRRTIEEFSSFLCKSSLTSMEFATDLGNVSRTFTMQTINSDDGILYREMRGLAVKGFVDDMQTWVTALSKLCEFTISSVDLSHSEVELLTQGLSDAHQLHTLSLSACKLNNEHMSLLSPVLGAHPSIKSLTLNYNEIGDEGVATFVEHWKAASIIEKLSLQVNGIGSKGAELLVKALSQRSILWALKLSGNVLGFAGVKQFCEALPDAKVKTLKLPYLDNWIEYEDVTCDAAVIQEAKRTAAYQALLEGVRGNVHMLRVVDGSLDEMPCVQDEINVYLDANACGRGKALELQHTLPTAIWCHFFARSRMTCSLTFLFLRELPNLMMGRGNTNYSSNVGRKRRRDD